MDVHRPVVVIARPTDPMQLRSPVFSELQDPQILEPLETVAPLGLVLVSPAEDTCSTEH